MTENRFSELVNLYLDGELGAEERAELDFALKNSPECRKEFNARLKLHQAMRQALLSPEERALEQMALVSAARRMRSRLIKVASVPAAMAASLVLGFVLGAAFLIHEFESAPNELYTNHSSFDEIGENGLRHTFTTHKRHHGSNETLAAHMRLLGLRPELTSDAPALQKVDMAAHAQAQAMRLEAIERMSQNAYERQNPAHGFGLDQNRSSALPLPEGFDFSLANFN